MNTTALSRRDFLKATGSLTISVSILGSCTPLSAEIQEESQLPGSLRRFPHINAWVKILEDGRIRIYSGKVELGQGIRIAIKQMAAEELLQDLDHIEVVLAETGLTPNEGYTAGSASIQNSAIAVRHAAAAAREKLQELGATHFACKKEDVKVQNGEVQYAKSDERVSFYELLKGKQIEEEVQLPVELVAKAQYRFVGKPISREDIPDIVRGEAYFIQDMRMPDMLHARVLRPQNYQSELLRFDESTFQKQAPLGSRWIRKGNFLAVLAETESQAEQALIALRACSEWSSPAIFPDQAHLAQHLKEIAAPPEMAKEKGDTGRVSPGAAIKARYSKPYTMHASLGTACALALYEEEILHVWTHSQGIYPLREALATMLEMEADQLHLISVPGAGCFGHTVADDAAADAAILAREIPGTPIRVHWSRQDEHAWEPYGSAMLMELEAGLSPDGKIASWKSEVWTDSHSTRPNRDPGTVLASRYLDPPRTLQSRGYLGGGHRNADPYYDIPNMQVKAHFFEGPLRVSSLRSLGAFANIFAIESFLEELAAKAGKDPFQFRLEHLSDSRASAVVEKLQSMVADHPLQQKEGLGIAFCRYKNNTSYCAVAAKVSVDLDAQDLKLLKLWASVDVGEIINPDGLRNQVEGGMVQAASWTLVEEVRFDSRSILSRDWASYPILRMAESPKIEVALIDRPSEAAMGGGEVSIPPTGAAIANAIYHACGRRFYHLPIMKYL